MNHNPVYLKSNVVAEPLVGGWYAWAHLISPATCAMNVVGRHLKIMNSYIQAPQVHAAAVRNPKMLGGPFIDYPENRVEDIKRLRDQTMQDQRRMIEFAEGIQRLNDLLKREAVGFSLDSLYAKIPRPLQGYVELYYDLQNHPAYRLYEPLLYRSDYYNPTLQSLALFETASDDRPFLLSTPRLPDSGSCRLARPFKDPALDSLFRMRRQPGSYDEIREELAISAEHEPLFRTFFTESQPARPERFTGDGIRVRYFGHACVLIKAAAVCVMSDPIVSYAYPTDVPRYTHADLPDVIDYVVITHNHQDHVLIETLLQLRHSIRHVVVPRNGTGQLQDPSLKLTLEALGFSVIEIDEFDTIDLPNGRITGLPFMGEHADLGIRTKLCHHISIGGWSAVLAADSCAIDPKVYEHIHEATGDVDVLFLGMECDGAPLSWLYGPLFTEPIARDKDRSRRLAGSNCERASLMVERFHPKQVYIYAMGQEPWLGYIMSVKYSDQSAPIVESNRLAAKYQSQGIVAERLFAMKEIVYRRGQVARA